MIKIATLAFVASFLASSQACLTEHIARAAQASTASSCVSNPANSQFTIKNAQVSMEVDFKAHNRSSSATIKLLLLAVPFLQESTALMGQGNTSFLVSSTVMFIQQVAVIWQTLLATVLLLQSTWLV
jgi:hypothetical protein